MGSVILPNMPPSISSYCARVIFCPKSSPLCSVSTLKKSLLVRAQNMPGLLRLRDQFTLSACSTFNTLSVLGKLLRELLGHEVRDRSVPVVAPNRRVVGAPLHHNARRCSSSNHTRLPCSIFSDTDFDVLRTHVVQEHNLLLLLVPVHGEVHRRARRLVHQLDARHAYD